MEASDTITIFIISTGDGKMKGTPFDAEINALYRQSIKDMKGRRMPIVTVLQARAGKVLHYTENALPWPVVMPEPLLTLNTPRTFPPVSAPKKSPATNPPVVKAPVITPPPVPPTIPAAQIPNSTPAPVTPAPTVVATAPAPPPPLEIAPNQSATTLELGNPARHDTNAPAALRDGPAQKNLGNVSLEISDATTHKTNSAPAPASNPEPPPITPHTTPPIATESATVKSAPPPISPAPTTTAPQPPAKVVTAPANPVPATAPKPVVAAPANPSPPPTAPAVTPPIPPTLATASPEVAPRPKSLLVAGIALGVIALVLIYLIVRRSRDTSGPSLITRSMGNRKQ